MNPRLQHLARRSMYACNRIYARHFHELQVLSPCRLPHHGAAIIISNHTSALDPALIQSASTRMICWMMAREYYEMPAFRRMFELLDAIPVNRTGNDVAATRAALRVLDKGQVLGVFPEGRIEPEGALLPFHTGVALLAMRKRVSVYPTWLDGTQRNCDMRQTLTSPQSAWVAFGDAIAPERTDDRTLLEQTTGRYESAVSALNKILPDAVRTVLT
jgi:1-acyl-sn-glycerol-3-phosphate acyltransferase